MLGKVINIGSSSLGNSFYIELITKEREKPFGLLIECGFKYSHIQKSLLRMGVSMNDIDAVLVSHEHNDHSISIKDFDDRYIDIYTSQSVCDKYDIELPPKHIIKTETNENGQVVLKNKTITNGVDLLAFPIEHVDNSGNVIENYGYVITVDKTYSLFFAIDTKYIEKKYLNFLEKIKFNTIFIETNHIRGKFHIIIGGLQKKYKEYEKENNFQRMKETLGKIHHNERIMNSHFGLENAIRTLQLFDLSKTKNIYLTHLSASNRDNPEQYIEKMKNDLGHNLSISVCKTNGGFIH